MKFTRAYYLLLLYTLALCKPVLPVIQDILAHTFREAQHISAIHLHQGAHHTESAIAQAAQEQSDSSKASVKNSKPVSIHIFVQTPYSIPHLFTEVQMFAIAICKTSVVTLEKHDPPPKSC